MKIGHIMILNDTHSVNNLQKLFEKQQSTRQISSSSELYEFSTLYVQMWLWIKECLNTVSKIHSVISDCVTNLVLTKLW